MSRGLKVGQNANMENDWEWKVSWMLKTRLEPAAPAPSHWSDIHNNLAQGGGGGSHWRQGKNAPHNARWDSFPKQPPWGCRGKGRKPRITEHLCHRPGWNSQESNQQMVPGAWPAIPQAGETNGDCKDPAWTGQVKKERLMGEVTDIDTGGRKRFGLK